MDKRQRALLVKNVDDVAIGRLVPIDDKLGNDPSLLTAFTLWRKAYKHYFLTQFEPTAERTRKWLNEVVLKDNARIFFVILDVNGKAVGHCGVRDMDEHKAELDNVLRGENVEDRDFMFYVQKTLLSWLYGEIGLDLVILHVFSNNQKAIDLYSRLGFSERQRFSLSKIQEGQEIRYIVGSNKDPEGFSYIEMSLERSRFESRRGK